MATNKPVPGKRAKDIQAPEMIERYWAKFFNAHPIDAERHGKEALDWFRMRVSKDLKVDAKKIIQAQSDYRKLSTAERTMIGKLYLFEYEAVEAGDEEAGVYDKFPMVFFFNVTKTKEGKTVLYGLNVHYLTPKQRAVLYMGLMKLKTNAKWTPNTKLRLQWQLIKQVTSDAMAEKAVHAYRLDRLKSRLVEIPSNDWIVAAFLRVERWIHIDVNNWLPQSDTRRKVQNKNLLAKK